MENFTYLIIDEKEGVGAIIDPGWEEERLIDAIKGEGIRPLFILLTHSHFDHAQLAPSLSERFGIPIYLHASETRWFGNTPKPTLKLEGGERLVLGETEITVLHTPGHSPGSVCYLSNGVLFSGDTLFVDAIGRTDLEGGDAQMMYVSLSKLKELPENTIVYPGHNYGAEPASTIGEQKRRNIYLSPMTPGEFMRLVC